MDKPAFVIHVNELSPERKPYFEKTIADAGYTDIRIFAGVNASNPTCLEAAIKTLQPIKKNPIVFDHTMSPGQIGCLLSHLLVYKHIIDHQIEVCTVFEDDVYFHPAWAVLFSRYFMQTQRLSKSNHDIIFMGTHNNATPSMPAINTHSTYCTHAYMITLNGAKKLMHYLLHWDYNSPIVYKHYKRWLTGLYRIDDMIHNIQDRMTQRQLKQTIIWYCWNATMFACKSNTPLIGANVRNCGLVFQNDTFPSIVSRDIQMNERKNGLLKG